MKRMRLVSLVLMTTFVIGCDAWFVRRINVSATAINRREASYESDTVAVVRRYAADNGIPCEDNGVAIECWRQPIRIWAIRANSDLVVCYSAMGIPLERRKFQGRMDRLQEMLQERFGADAVSISMERCPNPPWRMGNSR